MAVYQRGAGDYVAEREQPEPGSDRDKELARLVEAGLGGWHRADEPEPEPEPESDEAKRPAKTDNKAAWVDWAVSQGADRGEAEKATKDDLIKAYGG